VLVIQADYFNESRIRTVVVAMFTSNMELANAPGNVLAPASVTGLPRDSVVNVSQVLTLDRDDLSEPVGQLPRRLLKAVDEGLRLLLEL